MHLAADRARHPAGVPAGLGGVDGGNQWYVEVFGQRDGRVGDQPVVRVHHVGPPGRCERAVLSARPARTIEWPMASVQAIMSVPKSNSCGSCAAATTRTPSAISSVDGCVLGSVPEGRRLSTTTSWPAAASAVAR